VVRLTHRWCGGIPSVPFEGLLITTLQVAETFAAYHRQRNGTADRRGAPPVGMVQPHFSPPMRRQATQSNQEISANDHDRRRPIRQAVAAGFPRQLCDKS
jgi:hypothetical protein